MFAEVNGFGLLTDSDERSSSPRTVVLAAFSHHKPNQRVCFGFIYYYHSHFIHAISMNIPDSPSSLFSPSLSSLYILTHTPRTTNSVATLSNFG